METARRAYKLQEFVAHESDVNCLNIGKKSSRSFLTGGVDRKVNLWSIGQPAPVLSLSGHSSSVESVTFDSAELLVLGGAYSGTVKLWDLEENKVVRTLTGHRSSCTSLEFHPFGEFFASGSADTDLKIWDIRRKGCIHTYKGHTREIKTIKFTPDGRWVVSGGEDNAVKLWDLTAGKLLHEFKAHTGAIHSINFHPHEFLLATGSSDRTVKFWDLETFEMIGSAGPEMTGVRSMAFHPDGKALFCGLDETLKVFSWEPVRCHDIVDMKWSILADLSVYEGKLLGCSYHESSVAVWVADLSLISPYAIGTVPKAPATIDILYNYNQGQNFHHDCKPNTQLTEKKKAEDFPDEVKETIKSVYVTSSDRCESAPRSTRTVEIPSMKLRNSSAIFERSLNSSSPLKSDVKLVAPKESLSNSNSARESISGDPKKTASNSYKSRMINQRSKVTSNSRICMPIVVPRERESPNHLPRTALSRKSSSNSMADLSRSISSSSNLIRSHSYGNIGQQVIENKGNESGPIGVADSCLRSAREEAEELPVNVEHEGRSGIRVVAVKSGRVLSLKSSSNSADDDKNCHSINLVTEEFSHKSTIEGGNDSACSVAEKTPVKNVRVSAQPGRTRSLVESWEKIKGSRSAVNKPSSTLINETDAMPSNLNQGSADLMTVGRVSRFNDDDGSDALLQNHDSIINSLKSRLKKLQMVRHLWTSSGVKGAITSISKLPEHSVQVDVISVLTENVEIFTLELFSLILPLLSDLLTSKTERHVDVSLEMLLKLVRVFGSVVRTTASSPLPVGVDLYAEERRDRCQACCDELEKIKQELPSLIKRGGSLARRSVELNLSLQD
ncbi:katanin p80 WD40 repeat-containing subunit B1 homolog KTN80.3-like [Wolffia australiana]